VEDIWGVGPAHAKLLRRHRLDTALDLKLADRDWVRRKMTVMGLQTVLELNGVSCLNLERAPQPKKTICSSRSFGRYVQSLPELREAVAEYTSRAAEKLRGQHSVCSLVQVFIRTNPHKLEHRQHSVLGQAVLSMATDHTPTLLKAALGVLERLFRPEHLYQKAGLLLAGLEPKNCRQGSLLVVSPDDEDRLGRAMAVLDAANRKWGRGTLQYAAAGLDKPWDMMRGKLSPAYTTKWAELPVVRA
jgi:DNA polymerase V